MNTEIQIPEKSQKPLAFEQIFGEPDIQVGQNMTQVDYCQEQGYNCLFWKGICIAKKCIVKISEEIGGEYV